MFWMNMERLVYSSASRIAIVLAASAAAVMLAACSSSSAGSGNTAPHAVGGGGSSPASGPPITIMEISGVTGPVAEGHLARPGIQAAVKAINAAGGIRGHQVDLVLCDDQSQLATAASCADQAASDSSIIATVSNNTQMTPAIDPVLEKARIASIGGIPYTPSDFTSPILFPTEGGGLAITAGMNEFPARMGDKKIALMVFDTSGGAAAAAFVNGELKSLYNQNVDAVLVPASTIDITSSVAAVIARHPDAVALAIPQNLSVAAINELRAQGYQGMIVGPAEALPRAVLKRVNNPGKLYVNGSYSYRSPAYRTFQSEMAKYQPSDQVNDYALSAWLPMHMFADVMSKSTQPLTRDGVLAAFNSLSDYTTQGLTPTLNYTKKNPAKGFDRLMNMTQVLHEVTGSGTNDITPVEFLNTLTGVAVPAR
jgi:branched-chain amino acid transport system substrate-binding protein